MLRALRRADTAARVACPGFCSLLGMQERDLVAVPEGIGNQRRRAFEDEFANEIVSS